MTAATSFELDSTPIERGDATRWREFHARWHAGHGAKWSLEYWSIVLPLTILSAYLLLWPRFSKRNSN